MASGGRLGRLARDRRERRQERRGQIEPGQGRQVPIGDRVVAEEAGPRPSRRERNREFRDRLLGTLSEETRGLIRRPNRFARRFAQGRRGALGRMMELRAQEEMLGYGKEREQLSEHLQSELEGGAPVDLRQQTRPTFDKYGEYLRERLGEGLTDEEEAAIRGREREALEGAVGESSRLASSRLAAAGVDPRSGLGGQYAGQVARARERGLADVERGITLADLARKGAIEGQVGSYTGLEEGAREYDVAAEQRRQAGVESGLGQLAGLGERRREFDTETAYGGREAEKARRAAERAGRALEPSDYERWISGVGGFFRGLGV